MRIVVALGGNALLRRGQALTAENQRENVRVAAQALAPIAHEHELIISHGNGPQVGLLALQGSAYKPDEVFPLDVLGAQTEGMIGYMIEQEMANLMPSDRQFATVLTMIEVNRDDPAFANPTKFVGPVYVKSEADQIVAEKGWKIKKDGEGWRRVVPSPKPVRILEIESIRWLIEKGAIVICAGGGGIPAAYDVEGKLEGIEAVIDKDYASELLARKLNADLYIMATDVEAAYSDWGRPTQREIRRATVDGIGAYDFPTGSMGPKVDAARMFVRATGRKAAIGALSNLSAIVGGSAGTTISADGSPLEWGDADKKEKYS
jgi:carbamate kinase